MAWSKLSVFYNGNLKYMSTRQWRWPVCLPSLGLEVAKLTVTEVLGNYEPRGIDTGARLVALFTTVFVKRLLSGLCARHSLRIRIS